MEELPSPILGAITEVCIVTPNHKKTMDGLLRLGIGPFQVFDFTPATVSDRSFRGQAGNFALKVCFAKQGNLVFEIMEPTRGESLMAEYLDKVHPCHTLNSNHSANNYLKRGNQEGIQHIAFDCKNIPMSERKTVMRERGFEPAMEGIWKGLKGRCHFCFFDTESSVGTTFETIDFSDDWEDPECEWYPRAPREDGNVEAKNTELGQ